LHAKGVDLFLHQQGLDTLMPSGRAMFQMLGVFAEFERSMIRDRVMAGLSGAKARDVATPRRSSGSPPAPQPPPPRALFKENCNSPSVDKL
jgi:DNA invertase Pin-like site-specific DNA recombinase